jgi:hypothetical protein
MIDFIKKLFILNISHRDTSDHALQTLTRMKRKAVVWVPQMKMIFALAALEVARTSKINFINQILSASVRYGSHALRILDFKYFQIIIYDMMQHHMKPKPNMLEAYTINIQ